MLWRDFLYLLDLVVYFVQQISAAVIVGWILFVTGKTREEAYEYKPEVNCVFMWRVFHLSRY